MKTNSINNTNFDKTIISTIDSEDTERGTYYLDFHIHSNKNYWTISKDENIMVCFNDESEAKDYFYQMIGIE